MLLDARHSRWIAAVIGITGAAAALYIPYHLHAPNGPTGGSPLGLTFGAAALGIMIFEGLLGARRKVPTWRVGRPETWMRGHLWLGFLTVPLVLFHTGFRLSGALSTVLVVLLSLVTVSGILGLILQQILPRVMTLRVPLETIYEQIGHVRDQLLLEADELVTTVTGPLQAALVPTPGASESPSKVIRPVEGSGPLKEFYLSRVRPFLAAERLGTSVEDASPAAFTSVRMLIPPVIHETLRDLEGMCEERRQLAAQARLHRWLHGWLLVHIPLSYALLLLSVVHAVQSVRY
jgi:hypothetical protein